MSFVKANREESVIRYSVGDLKAPDFGPSGHKQEDLAQSDLPLDEDVPSNRRMRVNDLTHKGFLFDVQESASLKRLSNRRHFKYELRSLASNSLTSGLHCS